MAACPFRSSLLLLGLLCPAFSIVPPEDYDQWTAEAKLGWWKEHLDVGKGGVSEVPGHWYTDEMDMCTHAECIHAGGHATRKDVAHHYECRQKGVHPTGIVSFVKVEWEPNEYTGMFQKADYGFARWGYQYWDENMFSNVLAAQALKRGEKLKPMEEGMTVNTTDCFVYDCHNLTEDKWNYKDLTDDMRPKAPMFMALKFFRGQVPSAAIHTGFMGLSTWDHLGLSYSNHLLNIGHKRNDTTPGSMSEQAAQRGTAWPGFTGLHDMAMYDQEGNLQHNIHFPYQAMFWPVAGKLVPQSCIGMYNETVAAYNAKLNPGDVLYEIWIKDTFAAPMKRIGKIILDSKIMMSEDTDRQVFFYHPRFDRDLVARPDFTKGYHCLSWWTCPVCPIISDVCIPTDDWLQKWVDFEKTLPKDWYPKLNSAPYTQTSWSCGHAGGARKPETIQLARVSEHGMRKDDVITVEPRSQMKHNQDWVCESAKDQWPNVERTDPRWTSPCAKKLVPGRPTAEPEYELEPGCTALPECSKFDGTWYSMTYPCRCGFNQCVTGQLCLRHKSACISWGPYAQQQSPAEQ